MFISKHYRQLKKTALKKYKHDKLKREEIKKNKARRRILGTTSSKEMQGKQ
jgi:hypothetical protein